MIDKVDNMDFAYKPVSYKDVDVKVDFNKLDEGVQRYLIALNNAKLNFNWNRTLIYYRIDRDETHFPLNDWFPKKMENIVSNRDNYFNHYLVFIKVAETSYKSKENIVLLVRNQAPYIRYALEIENYPKAFTKSNGHIW